MPEASSRPEGSRPPRPRTRAWHRALGLTGAAFLVLLVSTGILLQHPDDLQLDRRFVTAPSLLAWYGIHAPEVEDVYTDGRAVYAQLGTRVFRNGKVLAEVEGQLRGATTATSRSVGQSASLAAGPSASLAASPSLVATEVGIWLYDSDGRFIDRFDPPGTPMRLGRLADDVVVETDRGNYRTDPSLIEWRSTSLRPRAWSIPRAATPEEQRDLEASYLAQVLSWERLLLDLHSGRLLGPAGPYLVDAAALVLLITAVTGLILALTPRGS